MHIAGIHEFGEFRAGAEGVGPMVEVRERQIQIGGVPQLLISGEIHYFRLPRDQWEDRILKLKAAGGNSVASYIPWLCHELEDGTIDLTGRSRPELDLGAFIDLCARHDLWFFARPGPFVMAEMKNEGIPYRVYDDHPEVVPVGWDGAPAPARTVDYLAPAFLQAVRDWYGAVMPMLAKRLQPAHGNVIAVQLDNEVGMLSWVTNTPDLTDFVLADFRQWLEARHGAGVVMSRYGLAADFANNVRSPSSAVAGDLMRDLGWYMRDRFARYIATLREIAEEFGISGVPYIVNIHGTESGGGAPFPIGISQLYESYTQAPGYLAGSDHYLGDLTGANACDFYLMNAFMAAVNRPEQPLTSVEFEAGEGDYGGSLGVRLDPSAADFKLRMAIAQGNRLINYYLFTGGYNYRLDRETGDGNDRISFTGERHGINAPISPEGEINFTLPRLARTNRMLLALAPDLAVAEEEHDDLAVGFIPDYWMTESVYRGNEVMPEIEEALRRVRFGGPGKGTARVLQHLTYRYSAIDLQNAPLEVATTPVLVLNAARFMAAEVQRKVVDWLESGGRLLLHGEVPRFDMTGAPCTVLQSALGLEPAGERQSTHRYFLSVEAAGWLARQPDLRAGWAQTFRPNDDVLLRIYGADEACAFDIRVGAGRAIVLTADIPADLDLFRKMLAELGVQPGLTHDHHLRGIFLTSARTSGGTRFVHALNLDGVDKEIYLRDRGAPLMEGRSVMLRRRDGVMLPLNLRTEGGLVRWATTEVLDHDDLGITVRRTGLSDALVIATERDLVPSPAYAVTQRSADMLVEFTAPADGEEEFRLTWR